MSWPRGKVLGGSSNLNALIYIRGSRHDYDNWAKSGAEGWSYQDVLPYFLKSEDIRVPELQRSSMLSPKANGIFYLFILRTPKLFLAQS